MAAHVCEIINVELYENINILITNKYPISILHLTKGLIIILLTQIFKVYSATAKYTLTLKNVLCELAQIDKI